MDGINADIIRRAAEGDTGAFEQIYQQYSGFVYRVARQVAAEDAAEDITQDVFLTVFRKLADFQEQASLKTWIYRVTINAAINYGKKQSRRGRRETAVAEPEQITAKITASPAGAVQDRDTLEHMLGRLSPDQRMCLTLRSVEGLSYEEIAEHLRININTVRSRLKRAREKLMELRRGVLSDELG